MASPIIEKYERILAADPRSRIFVELARALVEAGDALRAAEICAQGLEHHPDSLQARVIYGRALLSIGRRDEGFQQFDLATSADPRNGYVYDLIGEALISLGYGERAVHVLETARALRPTDGRIRAHLERARELPAAPPDSPLTPTQFPLPSPALTPVPAPLPSTESPTPTGIDEALQTALQPAPRPVAPTTTPPPIRLPRPEQQPTPEPVRVERTPSTVLDMIPDSPPSPAPAAPGHGASAGASPFRSREHEEQHAAEVARNYEEELRQKLKSEPPPKRGFARRHPAIVVTAVLLMALAAGVVIFKVTREKHQPLEIAAAVEAARKGIARDTIGAFREAQKVLDEAREVAPDNAPARAASAELAALLAHDFGDTEARSVASRLLLAGSAGPSADAIRWLLAQDEAERRQASGALLRNVASGSPLVRAVAGELLVAQREPDKARAHLEAAARASPPMLRALAALGEIDLAAGSTETALEHYLLVLRAHPRHPRAAIGAAEARLRVGKDLQLALETLEKVAADEGSAPRDDDRLRLELALARLLAARGRANEAEGRLAEVASRNPGNAEIVSVQAEVLSGMGEGDRAIRAATAAARLAPSEPRHAELLARLQLRYGRERDLVRGTEGSPTRALRLYRGMALLEMGEPDRARTEFEAMRREGKMPAEAAAWMALAHVASGRRKEAASITAVLLQSRTPPPIAFVVRGTLDVGERKYPSAERHFRTALERDPELRPALRELGQLLLQRSRTAEARDLLEKALARDRFHGEAHRDLGRARLELQDAQGAARELELAVQSRPKDALAWRLLSEARLAMGKAADARTAGERALALQPRSAAAALAAGNAAAAQGDKVEARHLLTQAVKLAGKSREGAEARRALAALNRRR